MNNCRKILEEELEAVVGELSDKNLRRLLMFARGLLRNGDNVIANKKLTNGAKMLNNKALSLDF